jgi:hypothetical protein
LTQAAELRKYGREGPLSDAYTLSSWPICTNASGVSRRVDAARSAWSQRQAPAAGRVWRFGHRGGAVVLFGEIRSALCGWIDRRRGCAEVLSALEVGGWHGENPLENLLWRHRRVWLLVLRFADCGRRSREALRVVFSDD